MAPVVICGIRCYFDICFGDNINLNGLMSGSFTKDCKARSVYCLPGLQSAFNILRSVLLNLTLRFV